MTLAPPSATPSADSAERFPTLTAIRLSVIAYEKDGAARERGLETLSADAAAWFFGGKGANAVCLACIVDGDAWLAFRGSDDRTDWKRNLGFRARRGVHGGFLGEWLKLRGQVFAWLKVNHANAGRINLTGHSLGEPSQWSARAGSSTFTQKASARS